MKKQEKKDAVLYVKIKPSIKKWLKRECIKYGHGTLSGYLDDLFTTLKAKIK